MGIINTDKHDYKKNVEVYEFYAYTNSGEAEAPDLSQTYSLGEKVRVANFDGYFGEETLEKNDIHYGWELGSFFVSGYTDEVKDADGNMVFLKNVGDKVTLWFNLHENINEMCIRDSFRASVTGILTVSLIRVCDCVAGCVLAQPVSSITKPSSMAMIRFICQPPLPFPIVPYVFLL